MRLLIVLIVLLNQLPILAQDNTLTLSYSMFEEGSINLATKDNWLFKAGKDSTYNESNAPDWTKMKPSEIQDDLANENGEFEGWFRIKIKLDETFKDSLAGLSFSHINWAPIDLFINGKLFKSYGKTGLDGSDFESYNHLKEKPDYIILEAGKTYELKLYTSDKRDFLDGALRSSRSNIVDFLNLNNGRKDFEDQTQSYYNFLVTILGVLSILFWMIYFLNDREKQILYPSITISMLFLMLFLVSASITSNTVSYSNFLLGRKFGILAFFGFLSSIPLTLAIIFTNRIPKTLAAFSSIFFALGLIIIFFPSINFLITVTGIVVSFVVLVYYLIVSRRKLTAPKTAFVIGIGLSIACLILYTFLIWYFNGKAIEGEAALGYIGSLSFPLSLFVYIILWLNDSRKEKEKNVSALIKVTKEKKELLENQNIILEQQVNERTNELNQSLNNLKATQSQLIQAEKMASLGELTAGIAHEIQNPLNFVNNFSEVSKELLEEMLEDLKKGDFEEVDAIASDVIANLEKILHHGQRADGIVKGMLQHSRSNSGKKELTDINQLVDEYLRLAYHGLRAKDKSFNASLETHFDESLNKQKVIAQDIGRVMLNLITNAFYACNKKKNTLPDSEANTFQPMVSVSTKNLKDRIEISVEDNGNGIPKDIIDKIFQPFFTTKPTGEGTGLGLSLSYDIIKAHGGTLKVNSDEGRGTAFTIELPINQ